MALEEVLVQTEARMKKAIDALRHDVQAVRTGRASPALVEGLEVEAYGTPTPLISLAAISAPEPRLIVIQAWDKGLIKAVEKAIIGSDLGLTPSNDGALIRLNIPALTEERRKDLVKQLHKPGRDPHPPPSRAGRASHQDEGRGRVGGRREAARGAAPEAHRPLHPHRGRDPSGEREGDPGGIA